ncbi:MAG TPA: hypothetical protein PK096_03010 [Candidatus Saccharibacteria bacterium]|nr:hypothetical protein [Candidatus Saccharibacteria bacterium]HRK94311.1 hypothetical protein [Candidatus Saccharibacteria bacterium]
MPPDKASAENAEPKLQRAIRHSVVELNLVRLKGKPAPEGTDVVTVLDVFCREMGWQSSSNLPPGLATLYKDARRAPWKTFPMEGLLATLTHAA